LNELNKLNELYSVSQKKFLKRCGKPAGLPRRPGRGVATFSEIPFEKQSKVGIANGCFLI
jgi:hypothetical protein